MGINSWIGETAILDVNDSVNKKDGSDFYKIYQEDEVDPQFFPVNRLSEFSKSLIEVEGNPGVYKISTNRDYVGDVLLDRTDIARITNGYISQKVHDYIESKVGKGVKYRLYPREDVSTTESSSYNPSKILMNIQVDKPAKLVDMKYGVYTVGVSQQLGVFLKEHKMSSLPTDYIVPNKNLSEMVKSFFLNPKVGRRNKQGYLLYGKPGNGKSSDIYSLMSLCEELKMNVIIMESDTNISYLEEFRKYLNSERTVIVFEEMTERLHSSSIEKILSFMDGEFSWDNTITIATTNYPELFPANLVDRPGRFEVFIEYGDPTKAQIIELGNKFGFSEKESAALAYKDLSFDYVSFIMSKAKETGLSPIEVKEQEENKRKRLSSTFKGTMGIG